MNPFTNTPPDFDELVAYVNKQLDSGVTQSTILTTLQDNDIDAPTINRVMHAAFEGRRSVEPEDDEPTDSMLSRNVPVPDFIRNLTLFSGRIGRREYWLGQLYSLLLVLIVIGPMYTYAVTHKSSLLQLDSNVIYIAMVVLFLYIPLSSLLELSLIVRRVHDMERINRSDPVAYYLFAHFLIMFGAGDKDTNGYGAPLAHTHNPLVILGLKRPHR